MTAVRAAQAALLVVLVPAVVISCASTVRTPGSHAPLRVKVVPGCDNEPAARSTASSLAGPYEVSLASEHAVGAYPFNHVIYPGRLSMQARKLATRLGGLNVLESTSIDGDQLTIVLGCNAKPAAIDAEDASRPLLVRAECADKPRIQTGLARLANETTVLLEHAIVSKRSAIVFSLSDIKLARRLAHGLPGNQLLRRKENTSELQLYLNCDELDR